MDADQEQTSSPVQPAEVKQRTILWRFLHVYIPIALGAWLIHNGFTLIGAALIIWGLAAV